MNPNKEQIAQLEELKKSSVISLPKDGINVRNLYVSLINNKAHICTTCTSTVAEYKRRLLSAYAQVITAPVESKSILDDAKKQIEDYKDDPSKQQVQAKYNKKVIRYKVEEGLIFINGSAAPAFMWENDEVLPLMDFNSDDDLINNIQK